MFSRDCQSYHPVLSITIRGSDGQAHHVYHLSRLFCRKESFTCCHTMNFPQKFPPVPSGKLYWANCPVFWLFPGYFISVNHYVRTTIVYGHISRSTASAGVSVIWMNFEGNTNEISSVWFYTKFHRRFRSRSGPSHPRGLFVAMKIDSFRQNKTENIK